MATAAVFEGEIDVPEDAILMIDEAVVASKSVAGQTSDVVTFFDSLVKNYQLGQSQKLSFPTGLAIGRGQLAWTSTCRKGRRNPIS